MDRDQDQEILETLAGVGGPQKLPAPPPEKLRIWWDSPGGMKTLEIWRTDLKEWQAAEGDRVSLTPPVATPPAAQDPEEPPPEKPAKQDLRAQYKEKTGKAAPPRASARWLRGKLAEGSDKPTGKDEPEAGE